MCPHEPVRRKKSPLHYTWQSKTGSEYTHPKEIVHTASAKKFVREHASAIKNFLAARKALITHNAREAIFGDVKVTNLTGLVEGNTGTAFYKVAIDKRTFFVKEFERGNTGSWFKARLDLPSIQLDQLKAFAETLKEENLPDVHVADYHLAYTGKTHAYLVTDFYETAPIEIATRIPHLAPQIRKVIEVLRKNAYVDFDMLYSPKSQKIIITDLRRY